MENGKEKQRKIKMDKLVKAMRQNLIRRKQQQMAREKPVVKDVGRKR